MTYQEFNHIYYKFTKNKKGIKPNDSIKTNGYELKEFVEFALQKALDQNNFQLSI
jgi:hypothetical protein